MRAPGRVNLIGEHTDYNDGLVLPAAIDRAVLIAAGANGTGQIRIYATAPDASAEFSADAPGDAHLTGWARYPQGVAVQLAARGIALRGVDAVITGDLPIGSGLSSSAALEVALALTFDHIAGVALSPREVALLCHRAEVEFVGVPCGVMDQFAVALCKRGHALFLDCRSLDTHHLPLPSDIVLAVCDTGVRRSLQDSRYADRRRECQEAVRLLREHRPAIASLRDVTVDDVPLLGHLPSLLGTRARHVVTENVRVVEAAQALEGGEIGQLRGTFLASHQSLRDDYAVSCAELDAMVEAALEAPGCVAARMTGGGFGGAVVALVQRDQKESFLKAVEDGYRRRLRRSGVCFISEAAGGAQAI